MNTGVTGGTRELVARKETMRNQKGDMWKEKILFGFGAMSEGAGEQHEEGPQRDQKAEEEGSNSNKSSFKLTAYCQNQGILRWNMFVSLCQSRYIHYHRVLEQGCYRFLFVYVSLHRTSHCSLSIRSSNSNLQQLQCQTRNCLIYRIRTASSHQACSVVQW